MTRILNILSAAGALAMAATPLLAVGSLAHAAEPTVRPAYVQLAGLDLGRPSDAALFRGRVDAAAAAICGQEVVRVRADARVCRDAVRREAVDGLSASQRHDLQAAAADTAAPDQGARAWTLAAR